MHKHLDFFHITEVMLYILSHTVLLYLIYKGQLFHEKV